MRSLNGHYAEAPAPDAGAGGGAAKAEFRRATSSLGLNGFARNVSTPAILARMMMSGDGLADVRIMGFFTQKCGPV